MGVWNTIKKGAKIVSGVQAYQDRKETKRLQNEADALQQETIEENERRKEEANQQLNEFGEIRLNGLQSTVKVFLDYLRIMKFNYNEKVYQLGGKLSLSTEEMSNLEKIEMTATQALGTAAAGGTAAVAALQGVPTAVTFLVGRLATASTGAAISSLHGAAATNAVMAWLGGGSIASGGGGMAAGAAVLQGITGASMGILSIAAVGIITARIYSKKKTAAEQYCSDVQVFRKQAEAAWDLMERIVARAQELQRVTLALQERIETQLKYMEPLIYDFNNKDKYYIETFQQSALLVKAMSELSQVAILADNGEVSETSKLEVNKIDTILNRDL